MVKNWIVYRIFFCCFGSALLLITAGMFIYAYPLPVQAGLNLLAAANTDSSNVALSDQANSVTQTLEFVGSFPGVTNSQRVFIQNGIAYVVGRTSGLYLIDVLNPSAPTQLAFFDLPYYTEDVFVHNARWAFVANNESGLHVLDVSDVRNISRCNVYDTPGSASAVTIHGDYAYVADAYEGLQIFDVKEPCNAIKRGKLDTPDFAWDVFVSDRIAYVADSGGGLRIINIANPALPVEIGFFATRGAAVRVVVIDKLAYVATRDGGLEVIDVSKPVAPVERGFYGIPSLGVFVVDKQAYVAAGNYGLRVLDITDPTDPVEIATYHDLYAYSVFVIEDLVYVGANGGSDFTILRYNKTQPTATPTTLPTPTPTLTPTPTPPAGDSYEPNNRCPEAQAISADGSEQAHIFQNASDIDWARFDATANTTYRIEVTTPPDSPADVALELYVNCDSLPAERWDETFTPAVRFDFTPPTTGPVFLRLSNQGVINSTAARYQLSVRPLSAQPATGAVIIVAGRWKTNDPLQRNIHNVTDRVYTIFQAQGYTNDDIYYLATDPALTGYDTAATEENLRYAITQWAVDKVGPERPLTLYLMDHGDRGQFYLDRANDQIITPTELDGWLTAFEQAVPSANVNIVIEACYMGSFIATPQSISKAGRVVITSSDANWSAYASRDGAHFSDHFLTALQQGRNLFSSFDEAQRQVNRTYTYQNPWLDANGDNLPNQQIDFAIAAERGFAYAGTLSTDTWPPLIVTAAGPASITNRRGLISATVRDDKAVESVWAVVYAPSYVPPTSAQELTAETAPTLLLQAQGNERYEVEYPAFDEVGTYRVVIYAKDNLGNLARPVTTHVPVCCQLFLPSIAR